MTPAEIEKHFHPLLRPVAKRTLELLPELNRAVHARPGVAEIDTKGEFSQHWTSHLRELCELVYGDTRTEVRRILEIGAYEGRSTVFLAIFFPNAEIDTIDTFAGSDEHGDAGAAGALERCFDANTASLGVRIEKRAGSSLSRLTELLPEREGSFDLAYIDGSHHADDVYVDSVLCWRLVRPGGHIVWDDYAWNGYARDAANPKFAIDRFLDVHEGEFDVEFAAAKVCVRKRAPAPRRLR